MKQQRIFLNNKFVAEKDAKIPVTTHALHYGSGCFEGIRAYYNKEDDALYIFRMEDHFKRLHASAKILFISIPYNVAKLCQITTELLQKNFERTDIYIRPLAYKADPAVGNFTLTTIKDGFVLYTKPLGRHVEATNGVRVNISSWTRIHETMIPPKAKITGSYVNTLLAKTESKLAGYDETLFLDMAGHVVEGSSSNLFIIKDNVLYTPPIDDDILCGITRDTVMKLSKNPLTFTVIERSLTKSEVYQADEIFLTGTGAEIIPIIEVEGRKIGKGTVGKITKEIQQMYFQLVHGNVSNYNNYITKIYAPKKG